MSAVIGHRGLLLGAGGSATGSFADLVLSHGPAMYLRLNDASGATAKGYGTPDGSYANMVLGLEPLYAGGGASVSSGASNSAVAWDAPTHLPASMPAMTLGVIYRGEVSGPGIRHLIARDADAANRYWQFRRGAGGGNDLQFIKIKGVVVGVSRPINDGGIPGSKFFACTVGADGEVWLYFNGSRLGAAGSVGAVDYAGPERLITVGNRQGTSEAAAGDRFSEAFVIPKALTAADVAALAVAAGFA